MGSTHVIVPHIEPISAPQIEAMIAVSLRDRMARLIEVLRPQNLVRL
ncbi:hypothetical protein [Roseobacter sp. A03A-229]